MLQHSALLAFTFLGTVLILVPLFFHVRNKNVAIISLCLWLSITNLTVFINGVVWNDVPHIDGPLGKGYCDISTRVQRASQTALIGCAIAILRYLSIILSSKGSPAMTRSNKIRQNLIDIAIIFTAPIFLTIMQLILFREPRYLILQFYGCTSTIAETSALSLLVTIWAPLLGAIAIFYALAVLHALNKKRTELRAILRNSQSGLDVSRFTRLFIIAMIAIFVVTPVNFYNFSLQVKYIDIHTKYTPRGDFSDITIAQYPITAESNFWVYWFAALISIVFAALFGVGKEAFNTYKRWAYAVPGAESVFEFAMSSTTRLTRGVSSRFSSTFSRNSSLFTASRMTTDSQATDVFHDKYENNALEIEKDLSDDGSDLENGLKQDQTTSKQKKAFTLSDSLMQGHNQSLRGTSTSKVWSARVGEGGGPLHSPNKIKMQHMVTQESSRNSLLSDDGSEA